LAGIMYGLLPHTGCILFILFTILGVTAATFFIKPLLMSSYFFYILIALSFVFATISAMIYLKRIGILSVNGIKSKWRYLSILYGTTIAINIILFMAVFPYAANATSNQDITGAAVGLQKESSIIVLKVDIPCPGHAPLITDELKKLQGIGDIKFSLPNQFEISYDNSIASKQKILELEIFKEFKATVISG
jgi:hypothetical protein